MGFQGISCKSFSEAGPVRRLCLPQLPGHVTFDWGHHTASASLGVYVPSTLLTHQITPCLDECQARITKKNVPVCRDDVFGHQRDADMRNQISLSDCGQHNSLCDVCPPACRHCWWDQEGVENQSHPHRLVGESCWCAAVSVFNIAVINTTVGILVHRRN